ncbi:MAG: CheR family methyltransferase [Ktedonobacterales bacterium]
MANNEQLYDLVVIGSSAGGIEALALLVSTLPADFPVPLVIAQHLDPSRASHLGEILSRRSPLPVQTMTESGQQQLAPGVVYVTPADRDIAISDGAFHLHTRATRNPKPSIDLLLSSAASAYGERLIAVVLTGAGSDGAAGAREVKIAGGTVIIENPETASYPSMPASLAPTTVDIVANLDQIGPLLRDLLGGLYVPRRPDVIETLQTLLEQVRSHSGIDFSQYKEPTILRRLQRRMVATGALTIPEYKDFLQRHAEEYGRLIASFLINVTEFFRDEQLFTYLGERVIPDMIARAHDRQGHELRIWSAGCATGEEAYSLAILLAEALGNKLTHFQVRIFATDIDEDAVAFARRGIYSEAALAQMPATLKNRYFSAVEDGYVVTQLIRSFVVFGQHDLGQRAPFPHIDLVLCRNVLIYFTVELQKRALQLFAFSLRDNGYLVLGNTETVSPLAAYFKPDQPHLKVYRRFGERLLAPPMRLKESVPMYSATPALTLIASQKQGDHQHMPETERMPGHTSRELLGTQLLSLSVGVVVIDRNYDVQAINSAAYRLLEITRVAIGKDLLHLAAQVPTAPLRAIIDKVFANRPTSLEEVETIVETTQSVRRRLRVTCYPYSGERAPTAQAPTVESVVLLIADVTVRSRRRLTPGNVEGQSRRLPEGAAAQALGEDAATISSGEASPRRDNAAAMIRKLRAENQELRTRNLEALRANEELLVGQEEIQASNEEVKTLYEEMQASNEELETLNEEMEATVEELHATNEDLQVRSEDLQRIAQEREEQQQASERERARLAAILLSMADALLVVDANGQTALTNNAYRHLFGEAGIPLPLEDPDGRPFAVEDTPQQRASAGKPFSMDFTLPDADGSRRWFEARGQPIMNGATFWGGVVSIRDITDQNLRHLQEQFLAMASHELRTPITTIQMALQLVARQLAPNKEERPAQLVGIALTQVGQLRLMVDDLADLGGIRRGELTLTLQPLDLSALLNQVIASMRVREFDGADSPAQLPREERRIVFQETPAGEPVEIAGDPQRVEQIVTNLLNNAIKYAHGSARSDVRLRQLDDMAEIEVQDYGPGIPLATQPQLFSAFYQVTRTNSANRGGVGLGLFIVQSLVKAHGGSISVRSEEGKGATFVVRLPLLHAFAAGSRTTNQLEETQRD